MKFIHHPHLRIQGFEEIKGPLAVVSTKSFGLVRVDSRQLRPENAVLELTLSDDVNHPDKSDWSQIDFENFVGMVIAEIAELQGQSTRLIIESIVQTIPASISRPEAAGPANRNAYWITTFDITQGKV